MKRRKKRQNNGLFLHFAHWETLKISEANGKTRLCILGHGQTLVTKRGAFWGGEYQIVIITDGARSLPYKGATKKSAKKKNESEMALHCIASMCTNTDVNPAGLKDRDRDRKREES